MESKKYSLNREDGQKILKGFFIALAGSGLAYLGDSFQIIDFGVNQAIIYPILSTLVNTLIKFLSGYSDK